jgi:hypothetical protein
MAGFRAWEQSSLVGLIPNKDAGAFRDMQYHLTHQTKCKPQNLHRLPPLRLQMTRAVMGDAAPRKTQSAILMRPV